MQLTRVVLLATISAAGLAAQNPAPIPQTELIKRLGAALDSLARLDQFSGVVLVAKNGASVFERSYGFADRGSKRSNSTVTAFNIGSINKMFTNIALRQLAAEGKLDLDSTLATYWPDYPNQDVARRVTIRQIMAHRSGIGGDIFGALVGIARHDVRHNNDYLQLFVDRPLDFEPGSEQQYSNAGFVVLGMLVERLAGQDYYRYVRERIYDPAGMTRTGAWLVDSLPPNTAIGYTGEGGPVSRNTAMLPGRGSAAGGGYTTAHDLMRFVQALRERRIPGGPPPGIGIAGGAPGLNAIVEGDLPGGYDLVVLANLDPPAAERVGQIVRTWLGASD